MHSCKGLCALLYSKTFDTDKLRTQLRTLTNNLMMMKPFSRYQQRQHSMALAWNGSWEHFLLSMSTICPYQLERSLKVNYKAFIWSQQFIVKYGVIVRHDLLLSHQVRKPFLMSLTFSKLQFVEPSFSSQTLGKL